MTKDYEDQQRREREALLLLALLTAADIANARDYWNAHAAPSMRGLPTGEGWTWDEPTQTYLAANGHKADRRDLKRLALLFALAAEADMRAAGSDVARQIVTIPKWQERMTRLVKDTYIAQAAVASGGFNQLSSEDLQRVSGNYDEPPSVAFSLDKLASFALDIELKEPRAGSEAAITSRSALYAAASNSVYEEMARESHRHVLDENGGLAFRWERNRLGPNENHCDDDSDTLGCVTVTDAGWQPIGSLPAPGLRTCAANCQCSLEFSLLGDESENN